MKPDQQASLWGIVSCINVEAADGPREGLGHMALLRSTGDIAKADVPEALECFAIFLRCRPTKKFAEDVKERASKCDDLEDLRAWLESQQRKRKRPAPPKDATRDGKTEADDD